MKAVKIAPLVTAAVLLVSVPAEAHVSVHPNTVPAGAFATLDVRVPGEQAGAHVTKVDLLLPPGFTEVDYENVPGWSVRTVERKLAKPIEDDGEKIESEIAQLVWSWTGPLGRVDDGEFVQFPLSVAIPDEDAGKALEFRTVQTYSNGEAVHWIDPSLDAEHPSPRINVTAKGGVVADVAGQEAGPTAGQGGATASSTTSGGAGQGSSEGAAAGAVTSSGGASKGLATAALIVGALGLLIGLIAVARTRRRSGV
ncbi:MAG TPA: YcnI family protein [Solirubrobacteraceae bacterium]|nr:YcnI family protein [Solirubrobacteraceae bacterium]